MIDTGSAGDDVVETGSGSRPPRPGGPVSSRRRTLLTAGAVLALLVVVAVVGAIRGGGRGTPRPTVPPSAQPGPSSTAPSTLSGSSLDLTGRVCGGTVDTAVIDLGFQVRNAGTYPVRLLDVQPSFPLQGLQTVSSPAAALAGPGCPGSTLTAGSVLGVGATGWIGMRLHVLVDCPVPLPVQAEVRYALTTGGTLLQHLAPFPDLGAVAAAIPCPTTAGSPVAS